METGNNNKKKLFAAIIAVAGVLLCIVIMTGIRLLPNRWFEKEAQVELALTIETLESDECQIFYWQGSWKNAAFTEENSVKQQMTAGTGPQEYTFKVPANANYIRIDVGSGKTGLIRLYNLKVSSTDGKKELHDVPLRRLAADKVIKQQDTGVIYVEDDEDESLNHTVLIQAAGEDPYVVYDTVDWNLYDVVTSETANTYNLILNIVLCLFVVLVVALVIKKIGLIYGMVAELWHSRKLIIRLSKNDFKTRYAGSYMGIFWAFVQPVITIFMYWFVFEKGLKAGSQAMGDVSVPFVLFLISGMVPWFFFSDALPNGTNALISYSYLVKKVVFKISILPIVKIMSSIYVHLFFMGISVVIFAAYGYTPDLYTLQIVYYTFATVVLVLGLSYITASIVPFFRDLSEIISIILQILVWGTPIMWNIDATLRGGLLKTIFQLNPMYYIVQGYRDALINKRWFFERANLTAYFWFVTLVILGFGLLTFRRLKKHFADVL